MNLLLVKPSMGLNRRMMPPGYTNRMKEKESSLITTGNLDYPSFYRRRIVYRSDIGPLCVGYAWHEDWVTVLRRR